MASATAKKIIPAQPVLVPFSGRRNLTESAAAPPMATALTAKQMLNWKGVNP